MRKSIKAIKEWQERRDGYMLGFIIFLGIVGMVGFALSLAYAAKKRDDFIEELNDD